MFRSDREKAQVESFPIQSDGPTELNELASLVPLHRRGGCALLAGRGVTVNGIPALPLQVLQDRDEIRANGQAFYFTTDGFPEVSVVRSSTPIQCARCLNPLPDGEHVIRCPACRAHHHPDCWNDGSGCQKCRHPMSGLSWKPESIW